MAGYDPLKKHGTNSFKKSTATSKRGKPTEPNTSGGLSPYNGKSGPSSPTKSGGLRKRPY